MTDIIQLVITLIQTYLIFYFAVIAIIAYLIYKGKFHVSKIVGLAVGIALLFIGGVTFLVTTLPGIGLVIWSITGDDSVLKKLTRS